MGKEYYGEIMGEEQSGGEKQVGVCFTGFVVVEWFSEVHTWAECRWEATCFTLYYSFMKLKVSLKSLTSKSGLRMHGQGFGFR